MLGVWTTPWGRRLTLAGLGAATALGQAPTDLWFVSVLALAAVFAIYTRSVTRWSAFATGWWAGLGYFAVALRWIVEPFLVDVATYGWMAPFAIVLMSGGAAVFWGLATAASHRVAPRIGIGFVASLTLAEVARSLMFTGFPWALLGHIWIETPLAQTAALWGPHGLTLITLIVSVSLARLFERKWAWVAPPALAVVAALLFMPPSQPRDAEAPMIRIVQPNIPQEEKWDLAKRDSNFTELLSLTALPSDGLDLIVWPESAVTELLEFAGAEIETISDMAGGTPVVTGIQRRSDASLYHNSLILIDQGGQVSDPYDKRHLVPFGEYFPGGELAARLGLRGFAASQGFGFTSGSNTSLLHLPEIGLARPLICYEGIFAEEIALSEDRPRVLLLITNDAWFGQGAGPEQHLAQARLRSIEQGLPMIRSANTGISAMIDAHGRVVSRLALNEKGVVDANLPPARPATIYSQVGDIPVLGAIMLLLFLAFAVSRRISIDPA